MSWHLEREKIGRAYCRSINANPDEVVGGYCDGQWMHRVRWWWYQESSPAAFQTKHVELVKSRW